MDTGDHNDDELVGRIRRGGVWGRGQRFRGGGEGQIGGEDGDG